jgi:hypothetical protein
MHDEVRANRHLVRAEGIEKEVQNKIKVSVPTAFRINHFLLFVHHNRVCLIHYRQCVKL